MICGEGNWSRKDGIERAEGGNVDKICVYISTIKLSNKKKRL